MTLAKQFAQIVFELLTMLTKKLKLINLNMMKFIFQFFMERSLKITRLINHIPVVLYLGKPLAVIRFIRYGLTIKRISGQCS